MLHTNYLEQTVPRIARALFGVGSQVVTVNVDSGEDTRTHLEHYGEISNLNGATIKTNNSFDHSYAHISAVLYSYVSRANVPLRCAGAGSEFMLLY